MIPSYSKLIGEYQGVLEGFLMYEIPDDVKQRLQKRISELEAITDEVIESKYPFNNSPSIGVQGKEDVDLLFKQAKADAEKSSLKDVQENNVGYDDVYLDWYDIHLKAQFEKLLNSPLQGNVWVKASERLPPGNPVTIIRDIKTKYTIEHDWYIESVKWKTFKAEDYEWLDESPLSDNKEDADKK